MTAPRKDVLVDEEAVYHCTSRCVRRAFLFGTDFYTGVNYDHRKEWIQERIIFLVQIFAIEVLGYALMENHLHTLLRTLFKLLKKLSDEEVARRWLMLYPGQGEKTPEAIELRVKQLVSDKKKIAKLRKRLGSISWFMKALNEHIARRANQEDGCKGAFWEGRFKCQRIEGEPALFACAAYIDLNPVRAEVEETPEESEYTSVYERIEHRQKGLREESLWLTPIADSENRRGFLSMSLEEYLHLLDLTGREIRAGKRGKIPDELAPILERIGIKPTGWLQAVQTMGGAFSSVIGSTDALACQATTHGKRWLKGASLAQRVFV